MNDTDDLTNTRKSDNDVSALQASPIGTALVDGDSAWDIVDANGSLEDPSRGSGISALWPHQIKGLAVAVDRAVKTSPLAPNLDVCLIYHPAGIAQQFPERASVKRRLSASFWPGHMPRSAVRLSPPKGSAWHDRFQRRARAFSDQFGSYPEFAK